MPTDKAWTMNCVMAGVIAARLIGEGKEEEAREWLTTLTSTLEFTDVDYLLSRIRDERK